MKNEIDKVCVIGLGEIGSSVYKAFLASHKDVDLFGVDVDSEKLNEIKKLGGKTGFTIPSNYDIYIVAVYTPQQIREVISKIDLDAQPLVVIESTMVPGESKKLLDLYPNLKLVLFPHRFMIDDEDHQVFNLDRIMGANNEAVLREATAFYSSYMAYNLIHTYSLEIVELAKPLENAYRYVEIAVAEELRRICDKKGVDFSALRSAANTKWNVNIKEARDGIGKHCLPKDCAFINAFFKGNKMFKSAIEVDKLYRRHLERTGIKTANFRTVDFEI